MFEPHTMPTRVAIIGAGGHASDVLSAIEAVNRRRPTYEVVGLYADGPFDPARFNGRGVSLVGGLDDVTRARGSAVVLAIGYPRDRYSVAIRLLPLPLVPAIVHPDASVAITAKLHLGAVVLAGARISPGAELGEHAHVSYNAFVGHDTVVGEFCSVMPLGAVAGNCVLGAGALIGSGAVVFERRVIGAGAVVAAGAVADQDLAPGIVLYRDGHQRSRSQARGKGGRKGSASNQSGE